MQPKQTQITVNVSSHFLSQMDRLVKQNRYSSHSDVVEAALKQLFRVHLDAHIEAQVAKLDHQAEIDEAEQGMDDFSSLVREK